MNYLILLLIVLVVLIIIIVGLIMGLVSIIKILKRNFIIKWLDLTDATKRYKGDFIKYEIKRKRRL